MIAVSEQRTLAERLHIDFPLLGGLFTLSGMGLVIMYSAGGEDMDLVYRQTLRLGIAFSIMFIVAQIPPRHLLRWSPWLYAGGIVLLAAVLAFGDIGKGARRWLDLGIFSFQPSELMKLAVPMMIAWFIADRRLPPAKVGVIAALVFILVPVGMIVKQPDLGTALLIAAGGVFVLFFAGIGWKIITGAVMFCAASTPVLWMFMHDYQRQRVRTFLNPEADPLGSGYHIIQSKIAIGSGGVYGKGWLNGTQSHLEFVPERATDFIFAVFSEEFGFLGILLLLSVYLFIVWRSLHLVAHAQETYGRLLGGALVMTFFVYVFVFYCCEFC